MQICPFYFVLLLLLSTPAMPYGKCLTGRKAAERHRERMSAARSSQASNVSLGSPPFSAGYVAAVAAPNGGIAGFSASGFSYSIPDEHGGGAIPVDPLPQVRAQRAPPLMTAHTVWLTRSRRPLMRAPRTPRARRAAAAVTRRRGHEGPLPRGRS